MDSQRDARAALEHYRLRGWREIGRELGRGSYAAVIEVDYKGLKCAGKKIYRVLYEDGVGDLVSRFEEECRLLSQLRHPHVVQFLGIYFDSDTNLPVLVMEFLPTTLAQCLDRYGVLPEEINYGILRDVALGLRYLHERPEPIVHRDLSANNVLLTSDMRGKISDLGVAKILNLSAAQRSRMTRGPGTPAYMPPEATVHRPRYDVKVDIFSYGVMMVHSLCGHWPFPGEAVRVNPNNPTDLTPVSEVSRRQEYLDAIPGDHPLMQLIHLCLRNGPAHRPDASYIAQQVSEAASRAPPSFSNKVEMMGRIRVDAEQREGLRGENERLTLEQEGLTGQVEELRQQVADQGERIETEVREKGSLRDRVRELSQQKEAGDHERAAKSLEVDDLCLQVTDLQADVAQLTGSLGHKEDAYERGLSQMDLTHQQALQLKDEVLASREEAYRQAIGLRDQALTSKDQLHRDALLQKDQAHQLALSQKDQAHQQALTSKDQTHHETLALKDQAHRAALQEKLAQLQGKETELSILQKELTFSRDTASRRGETISRLGNQLSRRRTQLTSNLQVGTIACVGTVI